MHTCQSTGFCRRIPNDVFSRDLRSRGVSTAAPLRLDITGRAQIRYMSALRLFTSVGSELAAMASHNSSLARASFDCPLTRLLAHSITHTRTHSLTHSLAHSIVNPTIRSHSPSNELTHTHQTIHRHNSNHPPTRPLTPPTRPLVQSLADKHSFTRIPFPSPKHLIVHLLNRLADSLLTHFHALTIFTHSLLRSLVRLRTTIPHLHPLASCGQVLSRQQQQHQQQHPSVTRVASLGYCTLWSAANWWCWWCAGSGSA